MGSGIQPYPRRRNLLHLALAGHGGQAVQLHHSFTHAEVRVRQRGVAVKAEFESNLRNQDITFQVQGLKPGYHISGSSVETRRFQAIVWGKCIHRVQPHHVGFVEVEHLEHVN